MTNKEVCQMDIGHEPPLEPPEPKIVDYCDECGGEIYEGSGRYKINGKVYCRSCVEASVEYDP